jgi:hypothetical protein
MFLILDTRLEENGTGTGLNESSRSEMKVHLLSLEELTRYFPDMSNKLFVFVKSITITIWRCEHARSCTRKINRNDIQHSNKSEFSSFTTTWFYVRRLVDCPALANIGLKILPPFPTTYESELGFSTLIKIKTKRSRLNSGRSFLMRSLLSTPRIKKLASFPFSTSLHYE